MKKHIIFLIVFCCLQLGFSQNKKRDSIKNLVDTYKERDSIRVKALLNLSSYNFKDNLKGNLPLLAEALSISKEIDYKTGIGNSYLRLSKFHLLKGELSKSLEKALSSKDIFKSLNKNDNIILSNSSIAQVYTKTERYNKSLVIHLENIDLMKNKPSSPNKASFYFYAANNYKNLKDLEKTEQYYKEALKISKEANFEIGVMISNSCLGNLYNDKGDYQKAIEILKKILPFYRTAKQESNIAATYFSLARSYKGLKKYKLAIENNEKAIDFYEKQKRLYLLKESYKNQSDYYELASKYLKSNEYLKKYYVVVDSLFSKERIKSIEDSQTKYETEKIKYQKNLAEKQTAITKLESQKNKSKFLGSLAILGLVLLTSLFYFSRLKVKRKAELITLELKETQKRLALEKQYKDSELKALKAQMNPHFIFNALNSIQEYILMNQKNLASDYLGKFASLIRNYLHFSDTGFISVKEEVKNLNLYLDLEKLRFEDDLTYIISVEDNLNADVLHIPTMIVQPYIENALKHGLLHKKTDRVLKIAIRKISNELIECIVEDNGIGREKSKAINEKSNKQHKSFALKATAERLELLNFGKDKKIGVEVEDILNSSNEVAGTKVVLKIPVTKKL